MGMGADCMDQPGCAVAPPDSEADPHTDGVLVDVRFFAEGTRVVAFPIAAQRNVAGQRILRTQAQLQAVATTVAVGNGAEAGRQHGGSDDGLEIADLHGQSLSK